MLQVPHFILIFGLVGHVYSQGCPIDWTPFVDEKCFLLLENYYKFDEARAACIANGGTLASIKEAEQQTFLTNFIFNASDVQLGVWIGANRTSDSGFQWQDGSPVDYVDWITGSPTEIAGRDCVAMQSRFSKFSDKTDSLDGKWKDVSCVIPNYAICEKEPTWSLEDLQKTLIENRKRIEKLEEENQGQNTKIQNLEAENQGQNTKIQNLEAENQGQNTKIQTLERNPVPVGFIYTQYSGQPEPTSIWPGVRWKEVTANYAGLFFRAVGGGSAGFGVIQNGDAPRITQAKYGGPGQFRDPQDIPLGVWSGPVQSGVSGSTKWTMTMTFFTSNPEIRPKNTAIRIWVREA